MELAITEMDDLSIPTVVTFKLIVVYSSLHLSANDDIKDSPVSTWTPLQTVLIESLIGIYESLLFVVCDKDVQDQLYVAPICCPPLLVVDNHIDEIPENLLRYGDISFRILVAELTIRKRSILGP